MVAFPSRGEGAAPPPARHPDVDDRVTPPCSSGKAKQRNSINLNQLSMGDALAGLADRPSLYFLALGFLANVAQGLSHDLTGEPATLMMLQKTPAGKDRFAHEWSHTYYFPCLLVQSVRESVLGY